MILSLEECPFDEEYMKIWRNILSLRMRMMIIKQFENLINELVEAQEELNTLEQDNDLIDIKSNIEVARNRIIKFREKTIKGFETKHKEKIKGLKERKRILRRERDA